MAWWPCFSFAEGMVCSKKVVRTIKEQEKWKAGIPYRGNKRQKVNKILDLLPNGERFIDAFGGGGCVSLHAATAMKFDTVVYNELDSNIFQLFTEFAIKHNQIDLKRFVVPNRERFFIAKNREKKNTGRQHYSYVMVFF